MSKRCVREPNSSDRLQRGSGGPPPPDPEAAVQVGEPGILRGFREWMTKHRGLRQVTLDTYARVLRALISTLGEDPIRYEAGGLINFLIEYHRQHGLEAAAHAISAMRGFLRYLAVEGKCTPGLDASIPHFTRRRLSTLPRYLKAEQVERVLASCDTDTALGLRDRMVLLLVARLGLRGGDVVELRLQDIDSATGTLRLGGKGRRETRLPLTQELGDALAAYLERGRPRAPFDRLFLRAASPIGPWAGSGAVSAIAAKHIRLAGISSPSKGAHVFRHSLATEMLRQGSSLDEIGTVLRHRSRESTALYAKVDLDLLKLVVQPWPEVLPC